MKSNLIVWVLLVLTVSCSRKGKKEGLQSKERPELPNIVLLVGDDQGYPYFGFMGADYVHTPNMDSLAQSGVVFKHGYVPENHCRPSLQTLMTGTLPIDYALRRDSLMQTEMKTQAYDTLSDEEKALWEKNYDFHAMKNFKTLPRMLANKGYKSFQGGKWWEFNYGNGGFDEGMTVGWEEADKGKNDWFYKFMGGEGRKLARATMQPVYDFVESNDDNPFFIWYAPELPHYPFDAPVKYYNLYKDKDMSESAKRYYANCSWFDDGVGELKRYLKEKKKFKNTLFIYVNDNGWEQNPKQEFRNDSLRWHNGGDKGKLSMYDQSFRTPIIFSWDGKIERGRTNNDLIHSADIPATILDYVGIDIPSDFYGRSYKGAIEGNGFKTRDIIIGKVNQIRSKEDMMGKNIEGYWLRNNAWFFKWNMTDSDIALYNIKNDPWNTNNLSENHKDMVEGFKAKINT
ncbi:unnamed protein product, partial [Ectocarpus sp. 12 AP-2014]